MRKKLLTGALVLLILLGCVTVGWAGGQPDPLISLSYLTETFLDSLKALAAQWAAEDTRKLYDDAAARAAGQTPGPEDGWAVSSGFVPGEGAYGETVILTTGSGLIWNDGSGSVSSGVLVDATAGTELAEGAALTAGHRYLAVEDTVVVTFSRSARWMAEGRWRCGEKGTVEVPLPFTDALKDQWYYDDVRFVVENGLFNGVSDTLFEPESTMERGMMTTVLHRLAKEPAVSYSPIFSDIPDNQWYTPGTVWCAQMGIVNGIGDGLFAPGQTVARQQIAVMLYNYAVKTGRIASERGDLSAFPDAWAVESWAQDAMSWAVGVGIINGSDGKLLPGDGAQRAQVAAMLHRFQNWLEAQV